jgi:hypothetical protein
VAIRYVKPGPPFRRMSDVKFYERSSDGSSVLKAYPSGERFERLRSSINAAPARKGEIVQKGWKLHFNCSVE